MKLLRWVSSEEWRWLLWYRSLSPEQRKAFRRITQLLRQISGAGQVQVLLSYRCSAERELATDDSGQPAIISAGGGAQAAVELRTVSPQYLGAVVVCDGADAPQVQLAVTQAVAQFTGLSTDRISVLKKQPDA